MSLYTTPILYLNMGGEMLYVLHQRLSAQGIDSRKSTQVLEDVTAALLNPKILSTVFEPSPPMSISCLRSTLECIALSSIMRLDKASMNKLFDLMIMMVKYQLTVSTGPREVVLLTLNHTDAMREMVVNKNGHECINSAHNMIVNLYGNMTMGQVWQTRNDCLEVVEKYTVRVSVLLRLGLQNNDTTFNLTTHEYDEKYEQHQDVLRGIKLNDTECENCSIGSFALSGKRGTVLGTNMYSSSYGQIEDFTRTEEEPTKDNGIRAELKMLEAQLGTEDYVREKIFTLSLLTENDDTYDGTNDNSADSESLNTSEGTSDINKDLKSNAEYKNTLDNIYADFIADQHETIENSINLLELLDEVQ